MPLISIIIPVYNAEKYLRRCLDSILAQTHKNWEAILVDDGSPDNCGTICDEYAAKDNRFKVIHQKNGGVVNARNNGIKSAKGNYLAFVDSDDFIAHTMFEEMLSIAIKEDLDIVWCDNIKEFEETKEIERIRISNDTDNNIKMLLNCAIPGYLFNKLISKDFWNKCGIITDEGAVMWEDTYISLQLLTNNPQMRVINKPLYHYNQTNINSATSQSNIMIKAGRNIIHIYEYLAEKELIDIYLKEFSRLALKLKIAYLQYDINRAYSLFPFAHKKIENYNLSNCANLFYYIAFNWSSFGKMLFKYHFKKKNKAL